jgi:hypothetical protein
LFLNHTIKHGFDVPSYNESNTNNNIIALTFHVICPLNNQYFIAILKEVKLQMQAYANALFFRGVEWGRGPQGGQLSKGRSTGNGAPK